MHCPVHSYCPFLAPAKSYAAQGLRRNCLTSRAAYSRNQSMLRPDSAAPGLNIRLLQYYYCTILHERLNDVNNWAETVLAA